MSEIYSPIKTAIHYRKIFFASAAFFAGEDAFENIRLRLFKKNKKNSWLNRPCRITPLLRTGVIAAGALAGVIFLTPAYAQGVSEPAEQIICPKISEAKAGSLLDEYYLARAYDKGYCGVTANQQLALQWYLSAAKHGHMLAQYRLGEIYFTGNGGTPDYPQAKKWFLGAALQGHGLSQLRLAFLQAEGHFTGLKTDYKEAEKWFLKAAQQNAGDAQFRLGNFYHNYKNPPDLQNAVLWLTRAAEGGHRVAMFDLARMLKNGQGTPKNSVQALFWMKKAADLDLLPAQMILSEMYAAGDGVDKDPMQSLVWTLKVAIKPTAPPFWIDKAGDIFFDGWEGIPKNYPQAMNLYMRAAAKSDPHALTRIGQMYMEGMGVPADQEKAREYLNKAVAQGSPEAGSLLAKKDPASPALKK